MGGGATVLVLNADTGIRVRSAVTNSSGEYTAPLLPVGTYDLEVDAGGFKHEKQHGLVLNVGDRREQDFTLQAGNQDQTVDVSAHQLQVQLQNASAEGLITGEQVRGLPLNNRNYEQLLALQPGVNGNVPDQLHVGIYNYQNQTNVASFSVGGGRDTQPLTVFQSSSLGDAAGLGLYDPSGLGSTSRPNLLFSPQKDAPHNLGRWFNPAAFQLNKTTGQPGNERRGSIRGPGYWRYDMALEKNFQLFERLQTQFRVEGFNVFNHTNFSSIKTSGMPTKLDPASPATFGSWGKVTGTRDPRIVQVALRVDF